MSTPHKLRGGGHSELTRLKRLWLHDLSAGQRDSWRSLTDAGAAARLEMR